MFDYKQYSRNYRKKNKAKCALACKKWKMENLDKIKAWRDANREKLNERARTWRKRNPEYQKNYKKNNAHVGRAWAERNKEKIATYRKLYRAKHRDRLNTEHRNRYFKRTYGLGLVDREKLLERQNGCCPICNKKMTSCRDIHIDHDHNTGVIREILCSNCNVGLGNFNESIAILKNAINYLNKWSARHPGH